MERFEKDLAGTGPCLRVWQIQEGLLKFQALHTGRAKDDNTQPTAQLDNPPITQISPIYSGRRKAEGRKRKAENRKPSSASLLLFCLTAFCLPTPGLLPPAPPAFCHPPSVFLSS